jgi:hypothetical protein
MKHCTACTRCSRRKSTQGLLLLPFAWGAGRAHAPPARPRRARRRARGPPHGPGQVRKCASPVLDSDRQRLWAVIEASFGSFDPFNKLVRPGAGFACIQSSQQSYFHNTILRLSCWFGWFVLVDCVVHKCCPCVLSVRLDRYRHRYRHRYRSWSRSRSRYRSWSRSRSRSRF